MESKSYEWFAEMFSYPTGGYEEMLRYSGDPAMTSEGGSVFTEPEESVAREQVDLFIEKTRRLTCSDLEELYTRTFDINPLASLEIGWHLYGEAYERGAFLVTMRNLLRRHCIEESNELPDHLTHVLRALGRMERTEADAFVSHYLTKALEKILEGFKDKDNPYEHLLLALKHYVGQEHTEGVRRHD